MFDVAAAKQNANLQTVVNEDGADLPVFQEKVVPELELIEDTVLSLILNVMKKIETSSLVLHSFEEVEHHLKTALELAIVFEELRWGMVASEVLNVCDQFLTLLMSLSVTKSLSQQSQDVFYYQSKFVILSK